MSGPIDRREATGLLAALPLAGCVGPRVLVNVAAPAPPPDAADLATGADGAGRITALVRLNGQGPFEFVVDTGANRTVAAEDLAQALGLPPAGSVSLHGVAGAEPSQTVTIDELSVGEVTSRRLRAPMLPRARLGADGLLGVDVLRDRRVILDIRRNRLLIGHPGAAPDGSAFAMRQSQSQRTGAQPEGKPVAVAARYRFGQLIVVDADASGRRITVLLDSGAQSTVGNLALRDATVRAPGAPAPLREAAPVLSVTGQTAQGELRVLPHLRIGGLTISRLATVFADLHVFRLWGLNEAPTLLLGMDVLRQFSAVELNYPRRQVVFYLNDR
ncbi:aspartyl protease family protein [Phenylobacterium sp.]|jgi:predicted aspartyl protease|uniref:aspartyl protease family protein n=1 Tax=Phenylobacterium sp. TaxID=1871053 RepID=UPI00378516D2